MVLNYSAYYVPDTILSVFCVTQHTTSFNTERYKTGALLSLSAVHG